MGFLRYLALLRIKRVIDFRTQQTKSLFNLLMLFISFGYALLSFKLVSYTLVENIGITYYQFLNYLLLTLIFAVISRGFFPSYKSPKEFSKPSYPLGNFQKLIANLIIDFVQPFFINIFAYILFLSILLPKLNLLFFTKGILCIIAAHLLRRCLHYIIEIKNYKILSLKQYGFTILLILLFVAQYYFFALKESNYQNIVSIIFLIMLFISFNLSVALISYSTADSSFKILANYPNHLNYTKVFIRNKKLRTLLLVDTLMKITTLVFDGYLYKESGEHLAGSDIFIALFMSPISIFTFYFNNLFGHCKALWFLIVRTEMNFINIINVFLKMFILPFVIDILLTFTFYFYIADFKIFNAVFYFGVSFILFAFGIANSLLRPKAVASTFTMNGNTTNSGNALSVLIVAVFMIVKEFLGIYSIFFAMLLSGLILYMVYLKYNGLKYMLFKILYN